MVTSFLSSLSSMPPGARRTIRRPWLHEPIIAYRLYSVNCFVMGDCPCRAGKLPLDLSKDLLDRVCYCLGIQVPVAAPHGLGLVADKLVNDPLVYPLVRQCRDERMPQHVVSLDHRPF